MNTDAKEEVWLGRDNIIEWVVTQDDAPVIDLSATTRATVCIGEVIADSDVHGSGVLWWTDSVTGKILPDGTTFTGDVFRARLGRVSTLVAGEYDDCQFTLWNGASPNGYVVADNINITVYDSCPVV